MRNISTKTHGFIEYALALLLWFAPTLFNFEQVGGPAIYVPRLAAMALVVLSLITNFELGLFKLVPMRVHLMIDYVMSVALAASPFLFGFNTFEPRVWMPHLISGIAYLAVSIMTDKDPGYVHHHGTQHAHA